MKSQFNVKIFFILIHKKRFAYYLSSPTFPNFNFKREKSTLTIDNKPALSYVLDICYHAYIYINDTNSGSMKVSPHTPNCLI